MDAKCACVCVCVAWRGRLKEGLDFDCLCGSKSLTELADLRVDGEEWVHPQDKHTHTLSPTRTHFLWVCLSLFLSFSLSFTHTVWLNNGPVSGVPMGKAVSLIESSILHSPCLLIDSVRLFCLTKRLTFPLCMVMTVTVRVTVCVFVLARYLLSATGTCVSVCLCLLVHYIINVEFRDSWPRVCI